MILFYVKTAVLVFKREETAVCYSMTYFGELDYLIHSFIHSSSWVIIKYLLYETGCDAASWEYRGEEDSIFGFNEVKHCKLELNEVCVGEISGIIGLWSIYLWQVA